MNCKQVGAGNPNLELTIGQISPSNKLRMVASAFNNCLASFEHKFGENVLTLESAYQQLYADLVEISLLFLKHFINIKLKYTFCLRMKENKTGNITLRYFHTPFALLIHKNYAKSILDFLLQFISSSVRLFRNEASGLTLICVREFMLSVAGSTPSSAGSMLPLPSALARRRGVLNIPTRSTQNCFIYSIIAGLFPELVLKGRESASKNAKQVKNHTRRILLQERNYEGALDSIREKGLLNNVDLFAGPVTLASASLFEQMNKDISINIFSFRNKTMKVYPLYLTTKECARHVSLLLIKRRHVDKAVRSLYSSRKHFALIQDTSKFFCNGNTNKRLLCKFCVNMVSCKTFEEHVRSCRFSSELGIRFPTADYYRFTETHKLMSAYYKISAQLLHCLDSENKLHVRGYSLLAFDQNENVLFCENHVGDKNVILQFTNNLFLLSKFLLEQQASNTIPLVLTKEEKQERNNATRCEICDSEFWPGNPRHSHHRHKHVSTIYVDSVLPNNVHFICASCNLNLKQRPYIVVFLCDAADATFYSMIEGLRGAWSNATNVVRAKTGNLLGVCVRRAFRAIDLKNFINLPLEAIAEGFSGNEYERYFHHVSGSKPLYFPHNCNDLSVTALPDRAQFFDVHLKRMLSEQEYETVASFWKQKGISNLHEYALEYMQNRAHFINACFQSLNAFTMQSYKISCHHDFGYGGLAYSGAMLKCRQKFEYLKCCKITESVLKLLVGPSSHMSRRHGRAFSERLKDENVDGSNRTELLSCDISANFGHVMRTEKFACGDYHMFEGEQAARFDLSELCKAGNDYGYILCVDLKYAPEIKKWTQDIPLVAERSQLVESQLTRLHHDVLQNSNLSGGAGVKRVLITQNDKKDVLLHEKTLLFYLEMGMKLTRINFVIQFRHKRWLSPFVDLNLQIKQSTSNPLIKKLAKDAINYWYGSFMSANQQLRTIYCTSAKKVGRLVSKSGFADAKILNANSAMIHMSGKTRLFDKNLLVAFTIMDLARLHFYRLAYQIKATFGPRLYVLASEIDALVAEYRDEHGDFIQKMKELSSIFDFSKLPTDHPCYSTLNAGKSGVFRWEPVLLKEYIKLSSKTYAMRCLCSVCMSREDQYGNEICFECRNKGDHSVLKGNIAEDVTFDTYRKSLYNECKVVKEYYCIGNEDERRALIKRNISVLACVDTKRVWSQDNLTSKPYGYDGESDP